MLKKKQLLLVISILLAAIAVQKCSAYSMVSGRFDDYTNHPCIRKCSNDEKPMVCEYEFVLETYSTLSRACAMCPQNPADCLREHCIAANGFQKLIYTANRLLPGPSIQVCKNDTIVVHVENRLEADLVTAIHWHGIRQKNRNHMDGPPMITQCPIMRNHRMKYE